MKAMLLAAGTGMRLRPLTDSLPKSMVEIGGRPILERNVEWLAGQGIKDVVVNLHHRPDVVMSRLGDGARWGCASCTPTSPSCWGRRVP